MEKTQGIDKFTEMSLLYDFYGALLSKRQREVTGLYYEDNLSLAEIAEEFGITRQGVHDALRAAEKALLGYEEKLGLMDRLTRSEKMADSMEKELDKLILDLSEGKADAGKLTERLKGLKAGIRDLEEL